MQNLKLHHDLTAAGISIPAGVTTAKSALDTFAARQPQPASANAIADAYRAGDTDAEIAALANTMAAQPAMLAGHRVALERYDRDLGAAIATAEATIVASIDTALAALDESDPADIATRGALTSLKARVQAA